MEGAMGVLYVVGKHGPRLRIVLGKLCLRNTP